MLFLVLSEPRPERPSEVAHHRQAFWAWLAPQQQAGSVRGAWARVPRGMAVIFDVPSNEVLHARLTEWAEMIPARFEIHPLIDPAAAQAALTAASSSSGKG
jgi:hypothetical protein